MNAPATNPWALYRSERWRVFQKERFPFAKMIMIPIGMAASAFALVRAAGAEAPALGFAFAVLGIYAFLVELRLMDELKDLDKDRIAHPTRPVPRGLIPIPELELIIRVQLGLLFGLAVLMGLVLNPWAGGLFAVCLAYLYLMYREFFVGHALGKRPFWYAVTHQIVIFPLICFAIAALSENLWKSTEGRWLATTILGAFFTYEVGRKLDPAAHPLLTTYLVVYGKFRTALMIVGAMGISGYAAQALGVGRILWPVETLMVISLPVLWLKPEKYKTLEALATLSLLAHLWAFPISRIWA